MKPYYSADGITLYRGDCRDILPELREPVRIVLMDPPYMFGMASTSHEGKAGSWADMMNAASFYALILAEVRKLVQNQQGACWMFNSWRSLPVLMRGAFEAQWPVESLLVWDKEWIGPGGPAGLRPSYELVALFAAPGFAIANRSLPDVWRSKWHPGVHETDHPAEKPLDLCVRLLRESGGGLVLDPFAGSGTTLVAAKRLGLPAIGIEMEERFCRVAVERLAQAELFRANPASAAPAPVAVQRPLLLEEREPTSPRPPARPSAP